MRPPINLVDELTLGNFKCFSTPQMLPLRPITLVYGPNGAGKSSVIQALKWLSDLSDGTWRENFLRFIRNFDTESTLSFGVKLSLARKDLLDRGSDSFDFRARVESAVETFGFQAELTGEYANPLGVVPFPQPFYASDERPPRISSVKLTINGVQFLELQHWLSWPAMTTKLGEERSSLKVANCNENHPIVPFLITFSKDLTLYRIEDRKSFFRHRIEGLPADVIERVQRLENAVRVEMDSIDSADLSQALEDVVFSASQLPVRAEVDKTDLDLSSFAPLADEPLMEYTANVPDNPESAARSYLLDNLRLSVILLVNFLHDVESLNLHSNPLRSILHLGGLRSVPTESFLLTDPSQGRKWAPDWYLDDRFESVERQIQEVNSWLESRHRRDTSYEICASRWEIERTLEGKSDKQQHLRFEGIRDLQRDVLVQLSETGTGFSQLLPILFAAFSGVGELVAIQHPELHLHPALQSELGDLFIARALGERADDKKWKGSNQFVLESHSEHLLLRIMRRIRETNQGTLPEEVPPVYPEDISVLYIDNAGDHTVVLPMPLSDDGQFLYDWPGGFFEEGLREVLM
jgi:hypothetical protein